jgi:hypothetical protein
VAKKRLIRLVFLKESVAFVATVSLKPAKLIPDGMDLGGDTLGETLIQSERLSSRSERHWARPLRVRTSVAQALLPVQIETQTPAGKKMSNQIREKKHLGERPARSHGFFTGVKALRSMPSGEAWGLAA